MAVKHRIDIFKRYQADNKFTALIDISRIYFYESTSEPWGIKDLDFRYIYVNSAYLALLNLPADFDITGLTFEELEGQQNIFSEQVRRHETRVITDKRSSYAREIKVFGREQKITPYIFRRMPYFSDLNTVSAIEFHGMPWAKLALIYSQSEYMNSDISTSQIHTPDTIFSEREWTILYLYCTGLRKKQVAVKLGISEDRVKKCIQMCGTKLISKLQIDTKNGIVSEIIKMGWLNYLPVSLMKEYQEFTIYHSTR